MKSSCIELMFCVILVVVGGLGGIALYRNFGPEAAQIAAVHQQHLEEKYPIGSRWYIQPGPSWNVVEGTLVRILPDATFRKYLFEDFRDCKSLYLVCDNEILERVDTKAVTPPPPNPLPPTPINVDTTSTNTLAGKPE